MPPFLPSSIRAAALLLALAIVASAADAERRGATPCPDSNPLRNPYFGDLHVHTAFSLDASTQDTRNRPADAYRFARGEPLGIQPYDTQGNALRKVRLERPLDFAAVTDHAELIGEWNICNTPGLAGHDSWVCRVYRRWPRIAFFWMNFQASRATRHDFCGPAAIYCLDAARGPWQEIQDAAAAAYERDECAFTSFVGYEWTGGAGAGNNFHRNVIFASEAVPELPPSFIDAPSLGALWQRLREECLEAGRGCDVVVIPHNPNLSGGLMFQTLREDGSPIDAREARERARFETLVEIMQHKGESECMLGLDTVDELCTFENLAMSNFSGRYAAFLAEPPVARQFVRNTLKEGLAQKEQLGVNPFKYGIIASTDTHLGTPGLVAEDAGYPGHGGAGTPGGGELPVGFPDALDFNPGGLAALWAEENTRESLFAAMRRREAYGTSGPRLRLRFFGGFELAEDWCDRNDRIALAYAGAVPMGGDLPPVPGGDAAPRFALLAARDAGTARRSGTQLQRLQIIKGWKDETGLHERVFEVAGDPSNGASVDITTCTPHGAGFDSLCGVWRDPDFDPEEHAFYYARAVENPTCRWSQQLCSANGVRCDAPEPPRPGLEPCCAPEHVPVVQERAWSSPIWYAPADGSESTRTGRASEPGVDRS